MNNMLQVEKAYQVEGDYPTLIKNKAGLLYKYLKSALHQFGILIGGIGGAIIMTMLALAGLFTAFAVCAFVKNCLWIVL